MIRELTALPTGWGMALGLPALFTTRSEKFLSKVYSLIVIVKKNGAPAESGVNMFMVSSQGLTP